MSTSQRLIVIRGNSGAGKATLAPELQLAMGRRTANIGQHHMRRVVLRERDCAGIRQAGGFDEPEVWRYDWEQAHDRDEVLGLVSTSGGMTRLPADVVGEVLAAVGQAVDSLGGSVTVAYATWGLTARRTNGTAS